MDKANTFPGPDTQAYRLLALTAVCGELPAPLLKRLPGSSSYKEALVTSLKKDRLLRTFYKDSFRGYRLGRRAKSSLLANQPERFAFYLTGNADTNLLKSELPRRLRLHRIAETYVAMQNAGVSIFRDEKPQIFGAESSPCFDFTAPTFYSSREIKEIGIEAVKIRNSRMTGVLLAPSGVFLSYNSGPYQAKWDYRAELRAQALLKLLCCQRLPLLHAEAEPSGLLFGNGLEPFYQILAAGDSASRCFFLLDGNYRHFYYLTNDQQGERLLRLLCDPDKTACLNATLSQGWQAADPNLPVENDAIDGNGKPVLFGYFLDIPRIYRFLTALQLQEREGILVCFDFQEEALRRLCGNTVTFSTIHYQKFERRFFPSTDESC